VPQLPPEKRLEFVDGGVGRMWALTTISKAWRRNRVTDRGSLIYARSLKAQSFDKLLHARSRSRIRRPTILHQRPDGFSQTPSTPSGARRRWSLWPFPNGDLVHHRKILAKFSEGHIARKHLQRLSKTGHGESVEGYLLRKGCRPLHTCH
jgi:hypothetical protein